MAESAKARAKRYAKVALMISITTAMGNAAAVKVRLECAQVTLDQSTLNQLLRTQTV